MERKSARALTRGSYDPSIDRQALHRLAEEFATIAQVFNDHRPLARGSFQALRRRCGKERCRCREGKLHQSWVFVERDGRRRRVRQATLGEEQVLKKPLKRYREVRRLRARLSKIHAEALRLCDRLSKHRLEEGRRTLLRSEERDP